MTSISTSLPRKAVSALSSCIRWSSATRAFSTTGAAFQQSSASSSNESSSSAASTSRVIPPSTSDLLLSSSRSTRRPASQDFRSDVPPQNHPGSKGDWLNKVNEDLEELNPSSSSPVTHSSLTSSEWWRNASDKVLSKASRPGTPYSGRSIGVRDGQRITGPSQANDIASAYRMLMARLGRNSIKKELRLAEYYEKPSDKKRRLAMERHRRRFQELVRQKVRLVQTIRNRK